MIQAHPLQVSAVRQQGTDAVQLDLLPEQDSVAAFAYRPGQYVTVQGGPPGGQQWRCYSINTLPTPEGQFSILVRRVPGGLVSNWIAETITEGDRLVVLPPAGRFTLRDSEVASIRLFAAGSGIGPIHALALHALEQGAAHVELFYANRSRATTMLENELQAIAAAWPERFHLHSWYDDESGLPQAPDLFDGATQKLTHVYTCGPAPFMSLVAAAASEAGVLPGHIFLETFELEDEPDADAGTSTVSASLEARIGKETYTLQLSGNETLLAAMLKAGLPVPHACRVGECASCMCRLKSGEVDRLENDVLDEDDEEDGWILACRTRAHSEKISIVFP